MNRKLFSFFVVTILLFQSYSVNAQTYDLDKSETYETLFSEFFESVISESGSVKRDLNDQSDSISTGFTNGMSVVTLIKLFDLYGDNQFLEYSKSNSDFIATFLEDSRYPLFATYYDEDTGITSNYRSVVDNFLIAWGLSELSDRIDEEDIQRSFKEEQRANSVINELDRFNTDIGFNEEIRIDTEETINSQTYNVFSNLFAAYIITESRSPIFNLYSDKPREIFDYVFENGTSEEGGVYSLIFNGFSDNLITLRNTAIFANIAMNLYEETGENSYLTIANNTVNFIQNSLFDIGLTGGYFESLVNGVPIQQSKSLFSHALMLQLLIKLANTGDELAKILFISLWDTISTYFRVDEFFISSLNRAGEPTTQSINTADNMMMMYATSLLPLFSSINYTRNIEYKDQIMINNHLQVPDNIDIDLVLSMEDVDSGEMKEISVYPIQGDDELISQSIELDPIRPRGEVQTYQYQMELRTQGVVTDKINFQITVSLSPGVDLSIGVITVISILAIVIFVLFLKRYDQNVTGQ